MDSRRGYHSEVVWVLWPDQWLCSLAQLSHHIIGHGKYMLSGHFCMYKLTIYFDRQRNHACLEHNLKDVLRHLIIWRCPQRGLWTHISSVSRGVVLGRNSTNTETKEQSIGTWRQ